MALQLPALTISKTGTFILDAGNCDTLGIADEFNALIFGNLNASGGDTDGRLGVAGNGTFSMGYSVGIPVKGDPIPTYHGGTEDMFIVAGDLADGNFGVNGNVVHGGERTGPVRVMTNGNLTRRVIPITFDADANVPGDGSGVSFADLQDEMEVRSALLGAFGERGVVEIVETLGGSGIVGLSLVGNDPDLNVFHLTTDELSLSSAALQITAPAGSTVLVNVYGDSVAIHNVGVTLNGVELRDTLFNLVDATSVSTSGFAWLGSVLAPYADGELVGGSIDGTAIFGGNVVTSSGFEFHNYAFNGGICTEIFYEFTVANTGNVTLTDIQIDDPVVDVLGGPISLDPGESDSTTFTARYLLKASDVINGAFTNTATASGQPPLFGTRVDASDSDTQTFTIPGIGSGGSAGGGGAPAPGSGTPTDTASNGEKPDLQINSVILTPAPATVGDTFSAVVEVENLGLWKAEGAVLRFWSDKSGWATVGEAGEAEVHLGTMEIGEVRTVTVPGFTTPVAECTYFLRAFADAEGAVEEQSEGNNQLTGTYTIFAEASTNLPAWMKPDFVVQSVELDPSPTVTSAEFDVIVRVRNDGHIAGDAGTLEFWAATPSYGNLSASPDQTTAVGIINPGEVVELTFMGLRAPNDQGTYHARVVVDADNLTEEYSTGNNQGGATYTVFPIKAKIEVHPDGMQISWNSAVGYTYYVERSTSLTGGFTDISGVLDATPSENVFVDDNVPTGAAVFYRVWGER
jgi:choice-of-anchor A domain-containing protein